MTQTDEERVVGADRVLAVLIALAEHPAGATLDELAGEVDGGKSTVHRALGKLRRSGLVVQTGRGTYLLGDEFFRLAFRNFAARPEGELVRPALVELAQRFGETAHYAVLEGAEVVYRAKVDPPKGAIRLTSAVGGRNPAQFTAVGKLLLAFSIRSEDELRNLLGDEFPPRTPHSARTAAELWTELERIRSVGYATDDQESEDGVNCVALPVRLGPDLPPFGAISVSGLAFRTPLAVLLHSVDEIRHVISDFAGTAAADQRAAQS